MRQCPRCDFTNNDMSSYCERCGTFLEISTPYSSPYVGYSASSQMFTQQSISERRPGITFFSVCRALLYFIGLCIATFGVVIEFVIFGNGAQAGALEIFFGLTALIAGVVVFMRMRHRIRILRVSQVIWSTLGATVGIVMLIALADAVTPNTFDGPVGPITVGFVFLLYGISLAVIALW